MKLAEFALAPARCGSRGTREGLSARCLESDPDTAARIHEAALRLFAAHGYAATGIRDVARDAGVTTAALYH